MLQLRREDLVHEHLRKLYLRVLYDQRVLSLRSLPGLQHLQEQARSSVRRHAALVPVDLHSHAGLIYRQALVVLVARLDQREALRQGLLAGQRSMVFGAKDALLRHENVQPDLLARQVVDLQEEVSVGLLEGQQHGVVRLQEPGLEQPPRLFIRLREAALHVLGLAVLLRLEAQGDVHLQLADEARLADLLARLKGGRELLLRLLIPALQPQRHAQVCLRAEQLRVVGLQRALRIHEHRPVPGLRFLCSLSVGRVEGLVGGVKLLLQRCNLQACLVGLGGARAGQEAAEHGRGRGRPLRSASARPPPPAADHHGRPAPLAPRRPPGGAPSRPPTPS
mmetsp:Transcript_60818/g.177746  ORF Transcript_60818/g.177746 Transcript_60818/m.177746 type:complete len:336 (+) Transcript_60818:338-1345(+)